MIVNTFITRENGQRCEVTSEVYSPSEFEQAIPVDLSTVLTRAELWAANDAIQEAALEVLTSRRELFNEGDR